MGQKRGRTARNLLEDWPSQARAGPAPNACFRFNAERQSQVLATNTENLIILLFNILRRVRVNPNSHQNTEKQESDGGVYYCCAINVYRNNMARNVK